MASQDPASGASALTPAGKAGKAGKRPFAIDEAVPLLRAAIRPYPKAAMFELADDGYGTLFEQLIACMLSIRTRDEVSLVVARGLFARARTPADVAALGPDGIDALIHGSSFHEAKAVQIHAIALRAVALGGRLPCDFATLTSLAGVGPKCANLALGIACGQPSIAVDVHVHRVTNRWGYVATTSPERTLAALEARLPKPYWIEINALLVPFGKHVCTGVAPRCSTCPLLDMCQQRGVTTHR